MELKEAGWRLWEERRMSEVDIVEDICKALHAVRYEEDR